MGKGFRKLRPQGGFGGGPGSFGAGSFAGGSSFGAGLAAVIKRMQENSEEATDDARKNERGGGILVERVVVTGTGAAPAQLSVTHKLGRKPKGFDVVRHRGGDAFTHTGDKFTATRIQFTSSSSCTIDLYVF